jgi:hypothetical protein
MHGRGPWPEIVVLVLKPIETSLILGKLVALSPRDRKAELPNNVDEAFGSPVAERQGYVMCMKTTSSELTL